MTTEPHVSVSRIGHITRAVSVDPETGAVGRAEGIRASKNATVQTAQARMHYEISKIRAREKKTKRDNCSHEWETLRKNKRCKKCQKLSPI